MKELLVTLFYLIVFNVLIHRYRRLQFNSFKPYVTHIVFNLKFLTGIFIWMVYTFYYKDIQNNDIHKFYNDALTLHEIRENNPTAFRQIMVLGQPYFEKGCSVCRLKNWNRNFDEAPFNENRTIIRLNALLLFVTFKTYFAHILFFCFISLVGWVLLVNSISRFTNPENTLLALPVMLLPSVLFWASGVMKEPLLIFGLGLLLHGLIINHSLRKKTVLIFAGSLIILFSKFFVLACLIPAAIAYLLFNSNNKPTYIAGKYAAVFAVLLLLAFNVHHITARVNPLQMLVNKQTNSVKEAIYYKAGSRIDIPPLEPTAASVLKTAPVGILNTLLRPYPTEAKNIMMLASAAENLLVVLLLVLLLGLTNRHRLQHINLVLFLLTFALAYFALIGMCTPVLGNLTRYRTPLLPVFLLAFVINVQAPALLHRLRWLLRG